MINAPVVAPAKQVAKAPWHLRLFGGFLVIFNGVGAFDYVMTIRNDAGYFERLDYGAAHLAYFEHYPLLPATFWTVAVVGAVGASVLLLLRSRHTVPAAAVAFWSHVALHVITFGFMDRLSVFGLRQSVFDLVVPLGLIAALYWYARVMSQRGVLR